MKKSKYYFILFSIMATCIVGLGALSTYNVDAQGTEVIPQADARVVASSPNSNYGNSTYLQVDASSQQRESYIKFTTTTSATNVKLMVYVINSAKVGSTVYATDSNWSENTINWNNKPAKGVKIGTFPPMNSGSYSTLDVSSYVKTPGTYSFVIVTESKDGVTFYARNGKNPPKLSFTSTGGIILTPSPVPATPRPTTTAVASTPNPTAQSICPIGFDCLNDTIGYTSPAPPTSTPTPTPIRTASPAPTRTASPAPTKTASPTPTSSPSSTGASSSGVVKIAFIGDSGVGSNFTAVANLIKAEGSQAVVHSGDLSYTSNGHDMDTAIDRTLGASFPYFYARGNHDTGQWSVYAADQDARLAAMGVAVDGGTTGSANYAVTFKGIKLVMTDSKNTTFVTNEFAKDDANGNHRWRVCSQHFVQKALHTGPKSDESSYPMYEACRKAGAIIATGHSHTYSRTKTLSSMASATSLVPTSNTQSDVRVSKLNGTSFTFTNGLGGASYYHQGRCATSTSEANCNIFAVNSRAIPISLPDSDPGQYGALFITFGDGAPNRATAYYKDIAGKIWDSFTITTD